MKKKTDKIIIILGVLSLIGTLIIYSKLPDKIPGHFNFQGEVDRYDSKNMAFFTGALPLGIYFLMKFLPTIDPKRKSYDKHKKAYGIFQFILTIFFIIFHWMIILFSLGYNINISIMVRISIGALFIILGNYMGQIRHNYFLGIKTPWTLANEIVWRKTHRVGGIAFIIAGLVIGISSFIYGTIAKIALIIAMLVAVVFPFIYSYIIFKKIVKE